MLDASSSHTRISQQKKVLPCIGGAAMTVRVWRFYSDLQKCRGHKVTCESGPGMLSQSKTDDFPSDRAPTKLLWRRPGSVQTPRFIPSGPPEWRALHSSSLMVSRVHPECRSGHLRKVTMLEMRVRQSESYCKCEFWWCFGATVLYIELMLSNDCFSLSINKET
jgi:hypothetical protein